MRSSQGRRHAAADRDTLGLPSPDARGTRRRAARTVMRSANDRRRCSAFGPSRWHAARPSSQPTPIHPQEHPMNRRELVAVLAERTRDRQAHRRRRRSRPSSTPSPRPSPTGETVVISGFAKFARVDRAGAHGPQPADRRGDPHQGVATRAGHAAQGVQGRGAHRQGPAKKAAAKKAAPAKKAAAKKARRPRRRRPRRRRPPRRPRRRRPRGVSRLVRLSLAALRHHRRTPWATTSSCSTTTSG